MEEKSLKQQNAPRLFGFIAFNAFVLWSALILDRVDFAQPLAFWKHVHAADGLVALLVPIVTTVLNGLLPASIKASLVFWRIRYPLPGFRAFSELARQDPRIDRRVLEKKHGDLPTAPEAQNKLWFRLSKTHQDKTTVIDAHRNYLLTRDITALSALFFLLSVVLSLIVPSRALLIVSAIALSEYVLASIAARNYGTEFVCNVLAEDAALPAKPDAVTLSGT